MDTTSYLPIGTLVLSYDDTEYPYEIRAVEIQVTKCGVSIFYTLLDPGCHPDAPHECGRVLYAKDVVPYTPAPPSYISPHYFQD